MSCAKYNNPMWIGEKFGMLTVLSPVHHQNRNGSFQWFWEVVCDCGKVSQVKPRDLITGRTVSCGCYRLSRPSSNKSHGESHTLLHNIWCGITNRCKHHPQYAGRGIVMCEEWKTYVNFRDWALSSGYQEGLTIERIDVNGNYEPENCTWIPLSKQARNRTTTKWVIYQGKQMSLAEAAELAELPYKQVHFRIKKGWSVEAALSTPIRQFANLRAECEKRGLNYKTIANRVYNYGWSIEDALNTPCLGRGANQVSYRHN